MSNTENREDPFELLSDPQRVLYAKRTYCKACDELGVKACSWQIHSGYQGYMDGKIDESQLASRADEEIRDLKGAFEKSTAVESKDSTAPSEEAGKRERARSANKVYRKVCSESGLGQCFFSNFVAWSDYVQGKMDESEFSEKAWLEVRNMKASADRN